jgi:hypothetical protein
MKKNKKSASRKTIDALWEDLSDRAGMPDFGSFDEDVQQEICDAWTSIIESHVAERTRESLLAAADVLEREAAPHVAQRPWWVSKRLREIAGPGDEKE